MKLQVKDHPGLVRDSKSKAIINVDKNAYNDYLSRKSVNSKVINMTDEINNLKNSVNEIKDLLNKILERS